MGLQLTQRAFSQACEAFHEADATQVELQLACDQLSKAHVACAEAEAAEPQDGSASSACNMVDVCQLEVCRLELAKTEAMHELVLARVVHAQESASHSVKALAEVGHALVKSFRKGKGLKVAANKVSCAQEEAFAAFDQLGVSWEMTRKLQEAWLSASMLCRAPLMKVTVAESAHAVAVLKLSALETVTKEAIAAESLLRAKREAREADMSAVERKRVEAEALEAEWRWQRDELRARLGAAHLETLKSRAAALEATERRSALQAWCSRTENLHLQLEASKCSAVHALRAETYNTKQVEEAYALRKRPRHD